MPIKWPRGPTRPAGRTPRGLNLDPSTHSAGPHGDPTQPSLRVSPWGGWSPVPGLTPRGDASRSGGNRGTSQRAGPSSVPVTSPELPDLQAHQPPSFPKSSSGTKPTQQRTGSRLRPSGGAPRPHSQSPCGENRVWGSSGAPTLERHTLMCLFSAGAQGRPWNQGQPRQRWPQGREGECPHGGVSGAVCRVCVYTGVSPWCRWSPCDEG